jgi:hypothetical protein
MRAVRTGSTFAEIDTEGLEVFLFDANARKAVRSRVVNGDDAWRRGGAATKDLVGYELLEDGFTRLEVAVGPPLSKKELELGVWHDPVCSRLEVKSGGVRVETFEALERPKPGKAGALAVDVPAGDYIVTLHRRRYADAPEGSPEDELPFQVVTLTPVAELDPPAEHRAWLPYDGDDSAPATVPAKVAGGIFEGHAFLGYIDLDPAAGERLGLRAGMILKVAIDDREPFEAVYLGMGYCQKLKSIVGAERLRAWQEGVRYQASFEPIQQKRDALFLSIGQIARLAPDELGLPEKGKGVPVQLSISKRSPELPALDRALSEEQGIADGAVVARVVACTDTALTLGGIGSSKRSALGKWRVGASLVATFEDGTRELVLGARDKKAAEAILAAAPKPPAIVALEQDFAAAEAAYEASDDPKVKAKYQVMRGQLRAAHDALAASLPPPAGPLAAWETMHWEIPDRRVLVVETIADGPFSTGLRMPVGSKVLLALSRGKAQTKRAAPKKAGPAKGR